MNFYVKRVATILLVGLSTKCCFSNYVTQPVSLNTSLDSTVSFTCEATDATAIVFFVDDISASDILNIMRGFTELEQGTINGTTTRSLSVKAQEINNNTNISCGTIPGGIKSETAILRIQGRVVIITS